MRTRSGCIALRSVWPCHYLLLGALNAALWPRAAQSQREGGTATVAEDLGANSGPLLCFGTVYAFTVPLLAPMLFGPAFGRSVLLGQVLSPGYCVAILANPLGLVGYALGLARIYLADQPCSTRCGRCYASLALAAVAPLGAALAFVANAFSGGAIQGVVLWRRAAQLPEGE